MTAERRARLAEQSQLRILVARPDRLGDVILSTPVFEAIRRHYPKARITALVREAAAPLLRGLASVDEVLVYHPERKHKGLRGVWLLAAQLRERDLRIGLVLQSNWKVALALFLGRVRYRVGPLSKIHSYLFYNRGVRQRRSNVEMHETDYNLQLLRRLGVRSQARRIPTRVHLSDEALSWAVDWLRGQGWTPDANRGNDLIVVHPGMGGSALNWPETHYVDLIRALRSEGKTILLTGGPLEADLLDRITGALGGDRAPGALIRYLNSAHDPITHLGALYRHARLVIAPSTGPLHLAVAVGVPVLTFYPPIRVQSALRWGPYVTGGADVERAHAAILVPEVYCGEDFTCRGSLCNYYPCMKSLTVDQALEEARRLLTTTATSISNEAVR